MKVEFKRSFARDLKKVKKEQVLLQRVHAVIEQVEQARALGEIQSLKKLRSSDHFYRIRIGDFRIGLLIENDTVIFVRFLHRKDVYRYFP